MSKKLLTLGGILVSIVAAEMAARYFIGTPPLSISHPSIDYMFAPNQDVIRFGNRQLINSVGMRSEPLDTVGERKLVLVFGDSVLNGGNQTSHEDLATTLATNNDVFFGNVSASSWGPGNYRAWIDEFGLFDADGVLFLLSDHDIDDQPSFRPLNPIAHPTKKPPFALSEIFTRFLPRYLPDTLASFFALEPPDRRDGPISTKRPSGLEDMQEMFLELENKGVPACILFHPTQSELAGASRPGTASFKGLADQWQIPTIDLAPIYLESGNTSSLYRKNDGIHINASGQRLLVKGLSSCLDVSRIPIAPNDG